MVKNVGDVIFNSVNADLEGTLEFGTADQLGIQEGAVGLAKNSVYEDFFTAEQKAKIEDLTNQVVDGEITVRTAIGMSSEELNELKASVAQ
jgi:basic membrane protein A